MKYIPLKVDKNKIEIAFEKGKHAVFNAQIEWHVQSKIGPFIIGFKDFYIISFSYVNFS